MVAWTKDDRDSADQHLASAIVVAAGHAQRMSGIDKIMVPLAGCSLVAHSLQVFQSSILIDQIVLVVSQNRIQACNRIVEEYELSKVIGILIGGPRRQDSVRLGLEYLSGSNWVIIHDGARPCLSQDLLRKGLVAVEETGAASAAVPVRDTIKRVAHDSIVSETLERNGLWAVQTPQVFKTGILETAHRQITSDVTDDASMVERCGSQVKLFMGSYDNIKITTPEDLQLAESIIQARGGCK